MEKYKMRMFEILIQTSKLKDNVRTYRVLETLEDESPESALADFRRRAQGHETPEFITKAFVIEIFESDDSWRTRHDVGATRYQEKSEETLSYQTLTKLLFNHRVWIDPCRHGVQSNDPNQRQVANILVNAPYGLSPSGPWTVGALWVRDGEEIIEPNVGGLDKILKAIEKEKDNGTNPDLE